MRCCTKSLLSIAFASAAACSAMGERAAGDTGGFRCESTLVLLRATVFDPHNQLVTGLEKSDFRAFEGKDEQRIVSVSVESGPVSVGIVFDASGSMKQTRAMTIEALHGFLRTADPLDEFFAVQVRDRPELVVDFTSDPEAVRGQLDASPPDGATALIDSVYLAASHIKHALHQRRMLLVISDGEDNSSRYSQRELKRMLEEADVTVYAIGVGVRKPPFFYVGTNGTSLLSEIARVTGGRYFPAAKEDVRPIMERIDFRYEYVVGFAPSTENARDGRYHHIQLKVSDGIRTLRVFSRPGYWASSGPFLTGSRAPRQGILLPGGGQEAR